MSARRDYKKRLMEYRKSIRATTINKTVAFKEPTIHIVEDIELHSPQPPPLYTSNYQQYRQHFELEDDDSIAEYRRSTPTPVSKTPSPEPEPQPQQQIKENSSLSEPIGRYLNWYSQHALLASQPWCCIGDLMRFCDKYEFKAISISGVQTHATIASEVKAMLNGKAPFDVRRRFPGNIRNEGNLLVCIGRCPSIEYHLQRILNIFRRPLNKLSTDKQNIAKQNFHIAIRELHLDVSARITEVKLYDRAVFEKEFNLRWQDTLE